MIKSVKLGDTAMLVNFEQRIDMAINKEVLGLAQAVENAHIPGVTYCAPAYCSVTVGYDPLQINFEILDKLIHAIYAQRTETVKDKTSRSLLIPVCYEAPFSLDANELEEQLGIPFQEIILLHTSTVFHVYMLGFLPGFAYMGILPEPLHCSRKQTPRQHVATGSVGLAGSQTGIYPFEAPGGWQIIGRTPIHVFNPDKESPFFFKPGDTVQFHPISKKEFELMERDMNGDSLNAGKINA